MSEAANVVDFARKRPFVVETFEDIAPVNIESLIKGVLPMAGIGFIVGASKGGKTFVAIDWSIKVACGATVMQRRVKQAGVVYLGAEDPDGCRLRISAWKRRNKRGSYTPFSFIGRKINLLDADEVDQLIVELQDIAGFYEANDHRLGLVVIDTFAACIPGADENGSTDGGPAIAALQRIGEQTGAFVLCIAHHGKAGKDGGIRGWSGFDAASDATITVERDEDDQEQRRITLSKVKNGVDGAQVGFRLVKQALGLIDEDGEEVWSCVVEYDTVAPEKVSKMRRKALSANAEIVMLQLGRMLDRHLGHQIPGTVEGVRPGEQGIKYDDLRLESIVNGIQYSTDEKPNTVNVRFGRALTELLGKRRARHEEGLVWPL